MNLNLPPSIRSKRRNMLLVGFTPGPNNPKDLDSFLWPLVEEMISLHDGIQGSWNAGVEEYFTLRAYITIVTADMPGREKLMRMKGKYKYHSISWPGQEAQLNGAVNLLVCSHNFLLLIGNRSYRYCNYCKCRGVWNTAIYCPFSPPRDPPETVDQGHWERYHRGDLPMRTNDEFRYDAKHIEETADKKVVDLTVIAGLSILAELPSIDFPRSFPPDSMHLFFENVIPALIRHYRGVFFKRDHTADGARTTSNYSQVQTERPTPGGSRKRKRSAVDSHSSAAPGTVGGTTSRGGRGAVSGANQRLEVRKEKFKKTSDPWNVGPKVWERIGRDQQVIINHAPAD